jgi:heme/copper-type cytochrome/quinol oxidase subunit 4
MDRQNALTLTIIFFIIFMSLLYYGTRITFLSSLSLSIFMSLVILLTLYPLNNLTKDTADFTLYIYGVFIVIGAIVLSLYILYNSICDVRKSNI